MCHHATQVFTYWTSKSRVQGPFRACNHLHVPVQNLLSFNKGDIIVHNIYIHFLWMSMISEVLYNTIDLDSCYGCLPHPRLGIMTSVLCKMAFCVFHYVVNVLKLLRLAPTIQCGFLLCAWQKKKKALVEKSNVVKKLLTTANHLQQLQKKRATWKALMVYL